MADLLSTKSSTTATTTNQQVGVQGGTGETVGVGAKATYVGQNSINLKNGAGNVTIQTDMGAVGAALDTVNHVSTQAINYANENLNTALQSIVQLQTNSDNLVSTIAGNGIVATTDSSQAPATGGVSLDYNELVKYGLVAVAAIVILAVYIKTK